MPFIFALDDGRGWWERETQRDESVEVGRGGRLYLAHPILHLPHTTVPGERHHVNLHTVAGGENRCLLNVRVGAQLLNALLPVILHREALTQLHRAGMHTKAQRHNGALLLRVLCTRAQPSPRRRLHQLLKVAALAIYM
jgi:hypothetical protein